MTSRSELSTLRVRDFQILHETQRAKSVREVARRLELTPGQISKSIDRMEKKLGIKLFKRSSRGVLLTSAGADLVETTADLVAGFQRIEQVQTVDAERKTIAIGSTSFLTTHFVTRVVCAQAKEEGLTYRFLDLPPHQMVAAGLLGAFDISVHFNRVAWPKTWEMQKLGNSEWVICARAGHRLGSRAAISKVLEYAFVRPTYWTPEGLEHGNDQFPIPFAKRKIGYETATADGAIPVLLETDQIAFLPKLLAKPFVERGELKYISPPEVKTVERELYISARSISVSNRLFQKIVEVLSKGLLAHCTVIVIFTRSKLSVTPLQFRVEGAPLAASQVVSLPS